MIKVDEYILTFPDGRIVGEGDLDTWLQEISEHPHFDQDQRDIAAAIVWRIRTLAN